ncbi:hypothetical protein MJO29_007699 [Puccinia striiformis f. sp. tritici]|uniref:Uncharacterized protein n=1 Tax=Puccinia striiformis f. sp. tritici PST-78 TaxID=1165861 RepID=A0A0L0V4P2_9BASI|nr:hypothetical protein Pst134EA_013876 [Puccinia striiformis f. sp. tritici]KAH9466025.1 hypothetical protein Pst134EA_013876 [Puccinia striiformis f. sp. tritici]KAI7956300.1 hypothetical protein MJO29_007699 [Puccinia striiformis f. sp. tritici]KAI9604254.1 hypothetical protein H4Q26_003868 [Puccinia striiformis f. sp. tritici PST-130]KNE93939.1 hypothetical protein PSTG_12739 [Puccinia striiformis f. sp. tritici PST-78]
MLNSARDPVTRSREMHTVAGIFKNMDQKYDFPPHEVTLSAKDPNLTIEDMATKSAILKSLQSNLLPAIKEHIISLLESLDDLDEEYPRPKNVDMTLTILLGLDQTLQTTVSSTLILVDESPLPDEKHDHHLEQLKSYRCSQLRFRIKSIVEYVTNSLLQSYGEFIQSCAIAISETDPAWAWEEATETREIIPLKTADVIYDIDDTIAWSLESDWALAQRNWLLTFNRLNGLLADLTIQAHPSLGLTSGEARFTASLTEDFDHVEQALLQSRTTTVNDRMAEVASSVIPLAKLARILVKKVLQMLPRKRAFEQGIRFNSETLEQVLAAFGSMIAPIISVVSQLRFVHWNAHAITYARRDILLSSVSQLIKSLETTSTNITSNLLPLLHGVEHASSASDFEALFLTFKQPWDKLVCRLSDLVLSLEVEQ